MIPFFEDVKTFIASKTGVNTDIAGTATIFARLKQIYDSNLINHGSAIKSIQRLYIGIGSETIGVSRTFPINSINLDKAKLNIIAQGFTAVNPADVGINFTIPDYAGLIELNPSSVSQKAYIQQSGRGYFNSFSCEIIEYY